MADTKLSALTEVSTLAIGDLLYLVDVSDTTDDAAGSSRKVQLDRVGAFLNPAICDGRLTTETGVPVSTSDRTSQSTIYFTPYNGDRIAVYDGTRWELYTFTERSLTLSSLTSGKNYDVFIYDNSGTLTLELSAAWTNDTTRADALTTQDGIYVKSGATTRRYLGTIRTTSTTTTEDSGGGTSSQVGGKRFVWNLYNQVRGSLAVIDATDSWTYNTTSWRQMNGASGNKVEWVCGIGSGSVEVRSFLNVNASGGGYGWHGIGIDTTTDGTQAHIGLYNAGASAISVPSPASYSGSPGIGYHYAAWVEKGGLATFTRYGDNGGTDDQSGLNATVFY